MAQHGTAQHALHTWVAAARERAAVGWAAMAVAVLGREAVTCLHTCSARAAKAPLTHACPMPCLVAEAFQQRCSGTPQASQHLIVGTHV